MIEGWAAVNWKRVIYIGILFLVIYTGGCPWGNEGEVFESNVMEHL